jgi:rare lipoprotein A
MFFAGGQVRVLVVGRSMEIRGGPARGNVWMVFGLAAMLLPCLAGCAGQYAGTKHASYTVRGVRYHPMEPERALGFGEVGLASWYDERRFLRRGTTALGERFRAGAMAGAHKTVPIPCRVRIVNLENGRSAVIRINDRGPFVSGRIIDVTPAVAKKLGFKAKGLTRVEMEVLSVGDGRHRIKA